MSRKNPLLFSALAVYISALLGEGLLVSLQGVWVLAFLMQANTELRGQIYITLRAFQVAQRRSVVGRWRVPVGSSITVPRSSSVVLVLSSSEVMSSAQASQFLGRGHVWNGKEPSGRFETSVPQFMHLIVSPVLRLISFALDGPTPCKVWGFFLFLHMGP